MDDSNAFRNRIEYEDGLLNTRTTVFLASNAILLAAFGAADPAVRPHIAVLGAVVTVVWGMCSLQLWRLIKALTVGYLERRKEEAAAAGDEGDSDDASARPTVEDTVQGALCRRTWCRPTNLVALGLPFAFLAAWPALFLISVGASQIAVATPPTTVGAVVAVLVIRSQFFGRKLGPKRD